MNEIEQLQIKVAYQEDTIEALNQALIKQQRLIDELQFKMQHVTNKLKEMSSSNIASLDEETPPPHY
ncbi:SlyX family protein [Planctobacterium marinum]|uniref:SlyX family protein n=1 Tax=Planctobacterium marinum TaxID=1631968 RepID=UPI001E2A5617|nr:SlyX family protein [Planctobacterium marinum]MCC2606475.1 SlyX family protein [Planctobacterium marinum]